MEQTELKAAYDAFGVTFSAEYIPTSKRAEYRNRLQVLLRQMLPTFGHWEDNDCLAWWVTFERGSESIDLIYHAGLGHLPGYKIGDERSVDGDRALAFSLENGVRFAFHTFRSANKIPDPDPLDILYSLVMDSDALEMDFPDWADSIGANDDSINAQRTHELCREYGFALIRLFGAAGLEQLREMFQDY